MEKICKGAGVKLERDVAIFGHPDCNNGAFLLIARRPALGLRLVRRAIALVINGELPAAFVGALLTGRAQTINTGTHNFMDARRRTIR